MGNVLIIWFGISGRSAASLCKRNGYNVYVYDEKKIDELTSDVNELIDYYFIDKDFIYSHADYFEFAVISPSILPGNEIYDYLQKKNIVMMSEIELGYRYCNANIIAITGTNGKTSTSWICSKILENLGIPQCVYGNMGIGFAEVSPQIEENQNVILEVSAQHLHATHFFRPHISVITNIKPEHQTDYNRHEDYVNDKCKIFANQKEDDFCILNYDDEVLLSLKNKSNASILGFSKKKRLTDGASFLNGIVYIDIQDYHREFLLGKAIRKDYIEHVLIIALILFVLDIPYDISTLKEIPNITFESRLEIFQRYNERLFVNDSKATNPYSTIFAINCFQNIVLICGSNLKKKSDYDELIDEIVKKGCWTVVYRESGLIIYEGLIRRGYQKVIYVNELERAVEAAYRVSSVGDAIVFSPAGNSSPLYEDLYERGKVFKELTSKFILELGYEKSSIN